MQNLLIILLGIVSLVSCGAKNTRNTDGIITNDSVPGSKHSYEEAGFSADSAYVYLKHQVDFGPRVPNTEAHRQTADWLVSELKRHGTAVTEQYADLKAFDGTTLHARNIFGQFNPEADNRILLLAHYDCRPWADQDPDPEKRSRPIDGANDGASGVAVLLEMARQISSSNIKTGVDILFADAEDWGTEGDDDSWAMGARYFANNPVIPGYAPAYAILLDMVGGKDAQFPVEYFSQQSAPDLVNEFWGVAREAGYGSRFPFRIGSAVTDDHIEFIKVGIPAIDIIEYHPGSGFNPHWHTSADNLSNISKETLGAVGQTLLKFLTSR